LDFDRAITKDVKKNVRIKSFLKGYSHYKISADAVGKNDVPKYIVSIDDRGCPFHIEFVLMFVALNRATPNTYSVELLGK
jgi:hypothetical protein